MSTDMPEYDRRVSDAKIDELEEVVESCIAKAMEKHVVSWHPPMDGPAVTTLIADRQEKMADLEGVVDRMVVMLEGAVVTDLAGNVVGHERGLKETADQSYAMLQTIEHRTNGGIVVTQKIRPEWTRNQKIAAWSIAATMLVGGVANIVTFIAIAGGS